MKNKYTIYIPSKKRSNNCKTAIELQKEDINFKIVVEKNDLKNYLKFYNKKNIIVLDKENQGIAYARQFIKKYSSNKKELYSKFGLPSYIDEIQKTYFYYYQY